MKLLPINKIGKINAFPAYITHYSGNVFPTNSNVTYSNTVIYCK